MTRIGDILFSDIDHEDFLSTLNNQLAGEDSPNRARPDNKDICLDDFAWVLPQEIYLRPELLFGRERNTLAWVPNKRN